MAPLLEAFSEVLGDMMSAAAGAWRFCLCVALATSSIGLICAVVHKQPLQLLLCLPIGVLGLVVGLRWQSRAG